jgi:ribonuclease HI
MTANLKKVVIYTDGACSGNPGPGGWGAVLEYDGTRKEIFGYSIDTTNNRMELAAAIEALKLLKFKCKVELHTDSQYVKNGISIWINSWLKNSWRKNNNELVKNSDLWQKLYTETQKHDIIWHWVAGHSGDPGNDLADALAVKGKELAIQKLKCAS